VLRLLAAELSPGQPGGAAVVNRLLDVLFVRVVRDWLETGGSNARPWLRPCATRSWPAR
jgi:hypothetical protein